MPLADENADLVEQSGRVVHHGGQVYKTPEAVAYSKKIFK